MTKFGYIKLDQFTPQLGDKIWDFTRYEKDGELVQYTGIETERDVYNEGVVIIGDIQDMRDWQNEFKPKEGEI